MTRKFRIERVLAVLASPKFIWGIVVLFVLQAAWIALSSSYPMAFDEEFHLGLIRIYADHLNPFLQGQPPGADSLGAIATQPWYLYHYLMSFPYRLITAFTGDLTIQILILRAVNVGLFAWGLVLWRRLLLMTRASQAIVNFCILLFVLVPVVPLLGAQINYDNLLFPIAALAFMWALDLASRLSDTKRVDGVRLLKLTTLCLLASLVKHAFLPIFIAIFIYLGIKSYRTLGGLRNVCKGLYSGLRGSGRKSGLLLGLALLLSLVLFGQRYGLNMARYHTPVPSCAKVLTVKQCNAYGPWARNHRYQANKTSTPHNPVPFAWEWLRGMWLRLFFSVAGPGVHYQTRGPLTVPGMSAVVFAGAGMVLVIAYGRKVFRRYGTDVLTLTTSAAAFYVALLWLRQFMSYMRTAHPVAINGRYLFPVLLPLILLAALSANEFFGRFRDARGLKLALAAVAVAGLVWGGGALTYILRSNDAWYWDNGAVRGANHVIQDNIGPLVPGYQSPVQFLF